MTESRCDAFSIVGEEVVYESRRLTVVRALVRGPDGTEVTRELVRNLGAVSVVPVLDDGDTVVMVRQYRVAIGRELLEIPAGTCDVEGETPEATASRELIEEVGYKAGRLDKLCGFLNSPGSSDHRHVVFLGRDLEAVERRPDGLEERYSSVEHVRLRDTAQLIASGTISDAKSIIGLMLTKERLAG